MTDETATSDSARAMEACNRLAVALQVDCLQVFACMIDLTLKTLKEPKRWRRVELLAEALIERTRMTFDEVVEVLCRADREIQ